MVEIVLDGQSMISDDFFAQFFEAGFMPDYGGRNLDALDDDLRERRELPTLRWMHSDDARSRLASGPTVAMTGSSSLTSEQAHPTGSSLLRGH
jgi:RNAse (barnase) inhibitor barstar